MATRAGDDTDGRLRVSQFGSVPKWEHVGICVPREKLAATLAFYEEVFGWHKIREGDTMVFIGDGDGGRIELVVDEVPPLAKPHHGAFVLPLDQVDGAVAILEAAGRDLPAGQQHPRRRQAPLLHRSRRELYADRGTR
jgi:catechol 2,3-dioxygenase-like lactoylglutathione lyase family enzyme